MSLNDHFNYSVVGSMYQICSAYELWSGFRARRAFYISA